MKLMNIKRYALLLLAVIAMHGCNNNENAKVERAVNGFFEGMYGRDFTKARAHATPESV